MNNEQFRKLMLATSGKGSAPKDGVSAAAPGPAGGSALGSRQRASIPMTPRSVGNTQGDFARQLAERNNINRPQKKFKTSAPRGVKLASGYVDRAKDQQEEEDDRAERLKALEESLKKEEIDKETFENLRFQIAGGDLSSTHLVKGLDFKLLERIRRGEDVYEDKKEGAEDHVEEAKDVDDEFDQLEEQEVHAVTREPTTKKKGELSTVALAPGKKRTRDQILAELKASREAAKAAQKEAALGDRFKKIGAKQMPGTRFERDSKGREVAIIVDEDGHEKRKIRKLQPGAQKEEAPDQSGLLVPDKDAKPLGMEVPEQFRKKEEDPVEDDDIDIFDGVGDDYNPLAGMDDSDEDSDSNAGEEAESEKTKRAEAEEEEAEAEGKPGSLPQPEVSSAPRNYFKDSKTRLVSEEEMKAPSMSDPAIMAAIKRAAALNPIKKGEGEEDDDDGEDEDGGEAARKKAMEERRRRLVQMADRDDEDLDMGFGTSRAADEEDFDETRVKLSVWGEDDGGEGPATKGHSKRKRAPKKRKGDANSAADVLRVMEQRKQKS